MDEVDVVKVINNVKILFVNFCFIVIFNGNIDLILFDLVEFIDFIEFIDLGLGINFIVKDGCYMLKVVLSGCCLDIY